ncbi:MAG: glycosyltransferase [Myxococcales bacterium]|nr:glycosyltransferase [Myxococcales bacterium]
MRVLIVSATDGRYGADRAAYRLYRALSAQPSVDAGMLVQQRWGDDPSVLAPSSLVGRAIGVARPHLDRAMLPLYRDRGEALFSPALWPATTARQIRSFAPEIVNLHWVAGGMLPFESLAALGAPIVWTFHDAWAFTGGCHYPGVCRGYRERCGSCPQLGSTSPIDLSRLGILRRERAYRGLDWCAVTPSRWLASIAASSPLLRGVSIETIPNSLDLDRFRPIARRRAREWLGLPAERPLLLFGAVNATGDPRKGYRYLAGALELLERERLDASPVVVVFGGARKPPGRWHGFETHHLGRLADETTLALAYAAADCLVVPSVEDNLPNTILESLACGTPIIAFDAGGIPEMIEDGRTGHLVSGGDVAGLAQALQQVIAGGLAGDAVRQRCRTFAESEYAPTRQAQRYLSLFKERTQRDAARGGR